MSTGMAYPVRHRVSCSKPANSILSFWLLPHDFPGDREKCCAGFAAAGRPHCRPYPDSYFHVSQGSPWSQVERVPAVAFRLISHRKSHRLIACEVLFPRSNLREDEAWAVRPMNERKGFSATLDMCGRYAKRLLINGRDQGAAAQAITDLFWTGCTTRNSTRLGRATSRAESRDAAPNLKPGHAGHKTRRLHS